VNSIVVLLLEIELFRERLVFVDLCRGLLQLHLNTMIDTTFVVQRLDTRRTCRRLAARPAEQTC
jgi:hypothetical protein